MGKRGKGPKKENKSPKRRARDEYVAAEDMDDEIDAFHKQRDKIPLDINGDVGESDEDNEQPVFDFEDINGDEEEDDDIDDDAQLTGLAAKIARQDKYLRAKRGGVEDEMHDDDEDEEEKPGGWGAKKNIYYNADNVDYELQSSDEELPAEEEAEVLRLQREKAKYLSMEDFGLDDVSPGDSEEPTLEEILVKGKSASKSSVEKDAEDDTGTAYEEIEKDLNSLSREEQMDVVYSSAPELVGLLSELNEALEQLENIVNPLLSKVKEGKNVMKGGMHYLEVKQVLLLSYCQAINFYLLLKSEGQPVRDHPVIARLVEIKSLLDKTKQLDEHIAFQFEEILNKKDGDETKVKLVSKNATLSSDSSTKIQRHSRVSTETQGTTMPNSTAELVKVDSSKDHGNGGEKRKCQNDQVGIQSMEMLKVRAALEEKLKRKGIFSSNSLKPDKAQKHRLQRVNGQLETIDDFDDETINVEGGTNRLSKVSQLVTTARGRKPKIVSGDDDLPQRDDIGERRRKHELQVLAGAGINSEDELEKIEGDGDAVMEEDSETEDSEDDYYKQVKQQRAAKLAAKAEIYSRPIAAPSAPETLVDGKRQISYQMEKNRGLTRARKKLIKNPRKKYKLKHQKAVVRRKGQVRDIKKPAGPYGGEASGINAGISRSVRFKN